MPQSIVGLWQRKSKHTEFNQKITLVFKIFRGTRVGLGAVDYRYPEQLINMATFSGHPAYNSNTFNYDFAVITLAAPAFLGENVGSMFALF